jgi:C1A family cysteine protease
MSESITSLGWLPDLPSITDYTEEHDKIKPKLTVLRRRMVNAPALAASADLRAWCSPVENQLNLGACTAHAGVGMVEYYERRTFGRHIDASRLFVYKATRNLMKSNGDTGAYLRTTMEALVLFGLPPEDY